MQLVQDFQPDGALSGDDVFVVKRMDKNRAGFFDGLNRGAIGVVVDAVDKDDFRSVAFRGFDFGERGSAGDEDARFDAVACRCERDALRMVPSLASSRSS